MFCILAVVNRPEAVFIILRVCECAKNSAFFNTSPFQQGVSLLMFPLSLPNIQFFTVTSFSVRVCLCQLIMSCLSTPYDTYRVTITQDDSWRSEHLSFPAHVALCWALLEGRRQVKKHTSNTHTHTIWSSHTHIETEEAPRYFL